MRIALTGATGFIGGHLLAALEKAGHDAVPLTRADLAAPHEMLKGATALIHLAAIAHARGIDSAAYGAINRDLPLALGRAARDRGATFVFVSSINAETAPDTPYGASKAEAERLLRGLDGLELVIVRPAPVYGLGARGNFALLQRLAVSRWPLPFAGTRHRRSIIAVSNLVDALIFSATDTGLGGRTFTATDPGAPSTLEEIITALRAGMSRSPGLFPGPADVVFRESIVDGQALFAAGWNPSQSSGEALRSIGQSLASRLTR